MVWDPTTTVNLVLCIAIVVFAIVTCQRAPKPLARYIGIAFGLFGVSHLATLLGWSASLGWILILVRTVAYLTVAYALYREAFVPKIGS